MKKDLIALSIIIFSLVFLFKGVKIQSVEEYYLTHLDEITEDSETVFIEIRCDTILDNWDQLWPELRYEKYVPSSGIILPRTELVLRKGDTVFDILDRAVRYNRIQMECVYSEKFGSTYIQGINHLYEFSCGELSGWMYKVNNVFPGFGVDRYELKDQDDIVLCYTCDLGRDVGNPWELE